MRNRALSLSLLMAVCLSCRSASWVTHTDPLGFSVTAPLGWQVAGDRGSGRVTITGPAGQEAIVWPVFVPGAVDAQAGMAILQRLAAASGVSAAWQPQPLSSPGVVRAAGQWGDRAAVASFAWIGSLQGSAGFLYMTAAPAASYRAQAETLSRILETFRAMGAPTAAGDSAPNVHWVRWEDPKEQAFSLETPAGWAVSGGAFRFAPVDVRMALVATSPHGNIRITAGDSQLPTFTEPTQMLMSAGYPEGSWYSPGYGVNMLVKRYTRAAQFVREYVAERAATGCANLTFTDMRDRPDADAALNGLSAGLAPAGGSVRYQSGETSFTCEQNGQPASGYYFATSLRSSMPGMAGGLWQIEYLYGYLATRDHVAQAQQTISHMLATYQHNPQWEAMQQNVTASTSRMVAETQQKISQMISETFDYKSRVDDEISRRRENAILGAVDVVDPETGRKFKVENSSNYYWLDRYGAIFGTNTYTKPGWNFREMTALP